MADRQSLIDTLRSTSAILLAVRQSIFDGGHLDGYRTVVVQDSLCSASDEAHDAMLELFNKRYGQHIETTTVEEILDRLPK